MELKIQKISEHEIGPGLHAKMTNLRNASFPGHEENRSYGKQFPHFRLLAFSGDELVGQVGIDHRAMRFNEEVRSVFGVIDLCVAEGSRGQGVGTRLLSKIEELARESGGEVLLLLAHQPELYLKNGFEPIDAWCHWLRIDDHQNYGVAREEITGELMIKPLVAGMSVEGPIDFLGYLF